MAKRAIFFGGGYVASSLGELLREEGWEITLFRRSASQFGEGVRLIQGDITQSEHLGLDGSFHAAVYSISPDDANESAYDKAYVQGTLAAVDILRRTPNFSGPFLFTSSTSVYGERGGEWVDEETKVSPESFASRSILAGERIVLQSGLSSTVVRFGGIYGPGREGLYREVKLGRASYYPVECYSNRIHRDDCAGILFHLLRLEKRAPVYLGVDSEPTDRNEVIRWLANELSASVIETSSPTTTQLHLGNKRCSNRKIKESGYVFCYPSYREGYRSLFGEQLRLGGVVRK